MNCSSIPELFWFCLTRFFIIFPFIPSKIINNEPIKTTGMHKGKGSDTYSFQVLSYFKFIPRGEMSIIIMTEALILWGITLAQALYSARLYIYFFSHVVVLCRFYHYFTGKQNVTWKELTFCLSPKHVHYPQEHTDSGMFFICPIISSQNVNCFSGDRNAVGKSWFIMCQHQQWQN